MQKWILLVWTECLGCTKVGGGVLGEFYHKRHGKQEWIKNQMKAQKQKVSFQKKINPRKDF